MDFLAHYLRKPAAGFTLALGVALLLAAPANADRISNPVAEFNGLDKITGRITSFDVYIGETVQFGALQVTPRVCYSRDEKEAQRVDAFVEVEEITLDRKIRRIFNGWMFADSPGLNAVEHPIYDVWLKRCKVESEVPPPDGLALPDPTPKAVPEEELQAQSAQGSETPENPDPSPDDAGQTGENGLEGLQNGQEIGENPVFGEDQPGSEQPLEGEFPADGEPQPELPPNLQGLKPGTGLF